MEGSPTPAPEAGNRGRVTPGVVADVVLYVLVVAVMAGLGWHFWAVNAKLEARLLDQANVTSLIHPDSSRSATYYQLQTRVAGLRYRHAAFALYGQESRRNAGFMVGSMLMLIGGLFIIRRLEIAPFEAGSSVTDTLRFQLKTTSPGLFMAGLGGLIVLSALFVPTRLDVDDRLAPDALAPGAMAPGTADPGQQFSTDEVYIP